VQVELELTPQQREVVNYQATGDLLVKGIPGSGKTLAIVQRAAVLARLRDVWDMDGDVARVRVFTYNKMLLEWIGFLAGQLGEDVPELTTFHKWARAAMTELGVAFTRDDWDDDGAELLGVLDTGRELPTRFRAHHVLVDEGQDLTPEALTVIKRSALTSFTIAADKAQNIYPTGFTWKSLGIKVQGRSKSLSPSFRGTRQIAELAADVIRHDPAVDAEEWIRQEDGRGEGPVPEIYFCGHGNWSARDSVVRRVIAETRSANPRATIAILHRKGRPTYGIAKAQGARILDRNSPDMVSSGAMTCTIHSAKGLEFDTVILMDANDGLLPLLGFGDESEAEVEERERRLFYVAVTRARRRLVIMCDRTKPSRYLSELDPRHYQRLEC
jgi:superfamily I DNA/RNA helicase